MTEEIETLIEYPCDFPIKAMGLAEHNIEGIFMAIVKKQFPDQKTYDIKRLTSKAGKYLSITITVYAENRQQIDSTYQALYDHDNILMSL